MMDVYPQQNWIPAPEIARRFRVGENTARRWIVRYSLGRKIGGRWKVDPEALAKFLDKPPEGTREG